MAFMLKCPGCGQDAPWFPGSGVVCGCGYKWPKPEKPPALSVQAAERVNAEEKLGG